MEDHKKQKVDGFELRFGSDWIYSLESQSHWIYYWNQASLIWNYIDKSIPLLEIGVGTSFISNYLKSQGWKCTTIDIDEDKNPDIVADVSSVNLSGLNFDCVLAFEIFEHLPFPLFEKAVQNISQYNPKYFIFSVPWSERRLFELNVKMPKLVNKTCACYINKSKITAPNHFWELKKRCKDNPLVLDKGHKGMVSVSKIHDLFLNVGYKLYLKQRVQNIQFFVASK